MNTVESNPEVVENTVEAIKMQLEALMNSNIFTTDSIEGWICILLLLFVAWNIYKKALKFASFSLGVIFIMQVCYWLSFTGLNDIIPLSTYFKYDVLQSMAQCFGVGTRACDILLYIDAYIRSLCDLEYGFWSGGYKDVLTEAIVLFR